KTPELTVLFWVITTLMTPVSDAVVDLGTGLFGLGVTTMLALTALAGVLVARLATSRYVPRLYWLIVLLVSVVGTVLADNVIDIFGVAPRSAAVAFGLLLLGTLLVWGLVERTLSIHTIDTTRRDAFYWLAILWTFALGAAAGDAGFETLGLGYGPA